MPRRTKHDAELRLSIAAARRAMINGQTPAEAAQTIRDQLNARISLDRLQTNAPLAAASDASRGSKLNKQ
jgi:cytidylate kinase